MSLPMISSQPNPRFKLFGAGFAPWPCTNVHMLSTKTEVDQVSLGGPVRCQASSVYTSMDLPIGFLPDSGMLDWAENGNPLRTALPDVVT